MARVLREQRPIILGEDSHTVIMLQDSHAQPIKDLLLVPLLSRGETIGLLTLEHLNEARRITSTQVNMASTIASQVFGRDRECQAP